jgi:hypothetical protein
MTVQSRAAVKTVLSWIILVHVLTSNIRYILILSSHQFLDLPRCLSSLFAKEISYAFILFPSTFKHLTIQFTVIYCLTIKQYFFFTRNTCHCTLQHAEYLNSVVCNVLVYLNDDNELLFGINFEACGKIPQKFQKILHGGLFGD